MRGGLMDSRLKEDLTKLIENYKTELDQIDDRLYTAPPDELLKLITRRDGLQNAIITLVDITQTLKD